MKTLIIIISFLSFNFANSQDYLEAWKVYYKCSQNLKNVNSEINKLNTEYEKIKKDLQSGYFCSRCMRSKTEIEKDGKQTFEQHLSDVKGVRIPASQKQLDDAHKLYMGKYNFLFNSFENKKNSCKNEIENQNKIALDNFIHKQDRIKTLAEKELQKSIEKQEKLEQEKLAIQMKNEKANLQNSQSVQKDLPNVSKNKNVGIGTSQGTDSQSVAKQNWYQNSELQNTLQQTSESVQETLSQRSETVLDEIQNMDISIKNENTSLSDIKTKYTEIKDNIKQTIEKVSDFSIDKLLDDTFSNENTSKNNTPASFQEYAIGFREFYFQPKNNQSISVDSYDYASEKSKTKFETIMDDFKSNIRKIKNNFSFSVQNNLVTWDEELAKTNEDYREWNFLNEVRCGKPILRILPGCKKYIEISIEN